MDSLDELRDLLLKSGDRLADVFVRMIRAKAERRDSSAVFRDLTRLLTQTLAWAHLMGRRRVRIDVKDAGMRAFAAAADVSPLVPATTFEQAVEDILNRHPELAVGYEAVQKAYAEGHAFALAKSTEDIITERVQRVVAEGIKKGKGQVATAKVIEELSDFTPSYAENIFRTNAATAYAQGRYEEALDPDIAEVMPALEFVGRTSSPSRPNHIAAVGLIAATNDPIWDSFMPPLGYRGIAPWVPVSGAFIGGSKSWYSGPLIEINTRKGARLALTGNHPVLTMRGWKSAQDVNERDQLVRDLAQGEPLGSRPRDRSLATVSVGRGAVDDEHGVATAADVFESLCAERVATPSARSRARVLPLDFHGDGRFMDAEIDVVGSYVELPSAFDASVFNCSDEVEFEFAEGACATDGSLRSPYPLVYPDVAVSGCLPRSTASTLDDRPVFLGGTRLLPDCATRIGVSARLHSSGGEPPPNDCLANPLFALELLRAFPGEVAADEVIKVRRIGEFADHVYDFQTTSGWMVASGACISNCSHGVRLVSKFELQRRGLLRSDGSVMRYTPPGFHNAYPDPGFNRGTLARRRSSM